VWPLDAYPPIRRFAAPQGPSSSDQRDSDLRLGAGGEAQPNLSGADMGRRRSPCVRAHERGFQPFGGLVIQQPVPMAGHVLGKHHDRDGRLLVWRPSLVEYVQVGDHREITARYGDSTMTRGRSPGLRPCRGRRPPISPGLRSHGAAARSGATAGQPPALPRVPRRCRRPRDPRWPSSPRDRGSGSWTAGRRRGAGRRCPG
jgi:hypothetical protein